MKSLNVHVEGIGLWSPQLADFNAMRRLLQEDVLAEPLSRPDAAALSPGERRRAPENVLVAIEVASQAVAMSGRLASDMACVFASAYGDQATTDYMCRVLAHAPTELSPTRFHHSVHNASAGYWTIATGCRMPSSAVCAGHSTFGAGLLEAVAQVCAEHRTVLLVCSDVAGVGPLGELIGCSTPFGCALVLSPQTENTPILKFTMTNAAPHHATLPNSCTTWMHDNPSAAGLPLLAMLANARGECVVAASENLGLHIQMEQPA